MKKGIFIAISLLGVAILSVIAWYFLSLRAVSKDNSDITFNIAAGTPTKEIINNLYAAGLIKNKTATFIYAKLHKTVMQASTYSLRKNMPVKEIMQHLEKGGENTNTIRLTFIEGLRLEEYIALIAEKFNWAKDDLLKKLSDEAYLKELIAKYDFLTDDILNKNLYYPLEGYLYPDTYEFYKDATFEDVIAKMLKAMGDNLEKLNLQSKYSVHEILTMASIVEKESPANKVGTTTDYRGQIAQVIYKRLDLKMNLGMDVTAYYGVKKSMKEALTTSDLNDNNPYNTRLSSLIGLPVGPICSPSLESIKAVLNPASTNYVYFFADIKTGEVYFTDNYNEFLVFKEKYS